MVIFQPAYVSLPEASRPKNITPIVKHRSFSVSPDTADGCNENNWPSSEAACCDHRSNDGSRNGGGIWAVAKTLVI